MSCPLLQGRGGPALRGLHAPHRNPQSCECVVLVLTPAPEHEKSRGRATGLAHLITAPLEEEGLPGQRHLIPP